MHSLRFRCPASWRCCHRRCNGCGGGGRGHLCFYVRRCRQFGYCGLDPERPFCIVVSASDCRRADVCKDYGWCGRSKNGHTCVAANDADCRSSRACAQYGRCFVNSATVVGPCQAAMPRRQRVPRGMSLPQFAYGSDPVVFWPLGAILTTAGLVFVPFVFCGVQLAMVRATQVPSQQDRARTLCCQSEVPRLTYPRNPRPAAIRLALFE